MQALFLVLNLTNKIMKSIPLPALRLSLYISHDETHQQSGEPTHAQACSSLDGGAWYKK